MTRLGPAKVGEFLRQQADELTRIWRLARTSSRPEVFPGLVDDLVPRFFGRAGELLAAGAPPEEVWRGLTGVVRWPPARAREELAREWALLADVVAAACESVNADPAVQEWLTRAAAEAQAGTLALDGGHAPRPDGIVTALVFSTAPLPLEPTQGDDVE